MGDQIHVTLKNGSWVVNQPSYTKKAVKQPIKKKINIYFFYYKT